MTTGHEGGYAFNEDQRDAMREAAEKKIREFQPVIRVYALNRDVLVVAKTRIEAYENERV